MAAVATSSSSSCWASSKLVGRGERGRSSCFDPPSRVQLPRRRATEACARRRLFCSCLEAVEPAKKMEAKQEEEEEEGGRRRKREFVITPEKLDQWLSESIGEIVRNIGEAPFLVNIFSDGSDDEGARRRSLSLETENASPEGWAKIKKKWDEEKRKPDAVILVEELAKEEDCASPTSASRKTLGLVVQGRGTGCASSYILNTNRVRSSFGSCTHFCLVQARLGEPLDVQLKKTWLQGV